MSQHKRRRTLTPRGASATATLPAELLLEIVARSDDATLFRCAAACKLLRREILSPAFLRRVCAEPDGIVPPRMLAFLGHTPSVVRPPKPAASSVVVEESLVPFLSRGAVDMLEQYEALITSRGGLVVLARHEMCGDRASDMCVYDPMTGDRTFLPFPPGYYPRRHRRRYTDYTYVLLTAADGIGCSFLLLAFDMDGLENKHGSRYIDVRTLSLDAGGEWSAVTRAGDPGLPRSRPSQKFSWLHDERLFNEAVVVGGVVHWLVEQYVVTYDVGTATAGWINFPKRYDLIGTGFRLGSTPDGKLRLFGPYRGFTVCSWVMSSGDGRWSPRAKVDTLPALMSLLEGPWEDEEDMEEFFMEYDDKVEVESIGDHRIGVALLRLTNLVFLLDMDTRKICRVGGRHKLYGLPYVVDLPSRLSTMKIF